MKTSGSLMLVLLLGSVSPSGSTDYQKSFPQDIYAALRDMTASLVQLKEEIKWMQQGQAQLKTEVDKLKQQLQVRQVAFSASLSPEADMTVGPFSSHTPLVFVNVRTNIGNAYNRTTGVFTAPVRGVYHFDWTVGANADNSHPTGAVLFKNGENVFLAYQWLSVGFMTSSKAAELLLEAGDVVSVRLFPNSLAFDNLNHHTTFSGHLLFPM